MGTRQALEASNQSPELLCSFMNVLIQSCTGECTLLEDKRIDQLDDTTLVLLLYQL